MRVVASFCSRCAHPDNESLRVTMQDEAMIRRAGSSLKAIFDAAFDAQSPLLISADSGACAAVADERGYLDPKVQRAFDAMCRLYEEGLPPDGRLAALREAAHSVVEADAPYLVRYIFVRDLLRDATAFEEISHLLEGRHFVLNWGGSHEHRMHAIEPYLDGGAWTLIDIGCGNGGYLERFAPRYAFAAGYEKVRHVRDAAIARMNRVGLDTVEFHREYKGQRLPFDADVLITEVLEHMPVETAKALLRSVLEARPRRVVLTVPNRCFNVNYKSDGAFRHEDHHWEPDPDEFRLFLLDAAKGMEVKIDLRGVGDFARRVPSTLMAVLEFEVARGRKKPRDR